MQPAKTRKSDRITMELPLQIYGADIKGFDFAEESRTAVVTRHGAKIYSRRKMGRDQEIVVRCLQTGKESEARIVGEMGEGPDGFSYGIEFLDPQINIWDIEFPPLSQAEQAAGRTLLECVRCRNRELVYLDAMELEILETGKGLSRLCKRCTDISLWKVAPEAPAEEPKVAPAQPPVAPAIPPPQPARTQNERKEARISARMTACIRHPDLGEEIVTTENISRGGLTFRSPKRYAVGSLLEVALPYTRGGANIFVAARIEHADEEPGQDALFYGLAYIPANVNWPRR